MLAVNRVSVHFGGTTLFNEISFLVNAKDRIGLAGKNGAGKSTLLKILSGQMQASEGNVSKPNDFTIGYLAQDINFKEGRTVEEEAALAFDKIKKIENELNNVNHELAVRTDYESDAYMNLLGKVHELNEQFSMLGGFSYMSELEKVLLGLGFVRDDFKKPTSTFSGGWRMRIELAKILLKRPDLMLLDEPTNHLDIESIQWLEDFLANGSGAVILVSHDKTFLDNVTNRTIEISNQKIYDYKTNYSKYVVLRAERKAQQESEAKNQEKYIEHTEQLINKFRAKKNKAAFAQSLIKKLDKLEIVEVDDDDKSSIRFSFPPAPRSGKLVVQARNVSKSYGEKKIFDHVTMEIEREQKVAFVGKNGEGKSTMARIIIGAESCGGEMEIGHNVLIGYYAQNQSESLNEEKTVFETIDDVATGDMRKNVRGILGSFLFGGDTVEKKVKVLSGGEKARLAMCRLLLNPYNLLVLDEPTNHLDMRSKDVLKEALLRYNGSLIIVSHDRDFLSGLTQKVFEFRDGGVKEHIGDVNEYIQARKIESLKELEISKQPVQGSEKKGKENKLSYEARKELDKELRRVNNQIVKSEQRIADLEKEIMLMDKQLAEDASVDHDAFFKKYQQIKNDLESEMLAWEKLHEQLSTMNESDEGAL